MPSRRRGGVRHGAADTPGGPRVRLATLDDGGGSRRLARRADRRRRHGIFHRHDVVRRQRSLANPRVDLRLFANPGFTVALGGLFLGTWLMGAIMVFFSQYLRLVNKLSPLQTGLWMLPTAASVVSRSARVCWLLNAFRRAAWRGAGVVGPGGHGSGQRVQQRHHQGARRGHRPPRSTRKAQPGPVRRRPPP
jgi:hypothetical protein